MSSASGVWQNPSPPGTATAPDDQLKRTKTTKENYKRYSRSRSRSSDSYRCTPSHSPSRSRSKSRGRRSRSGRYKRSRSRDYRRRSRSTSRRRYRPRRRDTRRSRYSRSRSKSHSRHYRRSYTRSSTRSRSGSWSSCSSYSDHSLYRRNRTSKVSEVPKTQEYIRKSRSKREEVPTQENTFKNDGSFLEMFKKMQEEKAAEVKKEEPEIGGGDVKKAMPIFGKRRGGRVLKTGMVQKLRNPNEVEEEPKDAWSVYMKEVKRYKEACCDDDSKTRPLVK